MPGGVENTRHYLELSSVSQSGCLTLGSRLMYHELIIKGFLHIETYFPHNLPTWSVWELGPPSLSSPSHVEFILQREHWIIAGVKLVATIAGTPCSNSREIKYGPKLVTPKPTSRKTLVREPDGTIFSLCNPILPSFVSNQPCMRYVAKPHLLPSSCRAFFYVSSLKQNLSMSTMVLQKSQCVATCENCGMENWLCHRSERFQGRGQHQLP